MTQRTLMSSAWILDNSLDVYLALGAVSLLRALREHDIPKRDRSVFFLITPALKELLVFHIYGTFQELQLTGAFYDTSLLPD